MDDVTGTFLKAAYRLSEAAGALDAAVEETNAAQARHDDIVKRTVDLVKSREQNWDAKAKSSLASLSGKLSIQQRKLDTQKAALTRARETYEAEKALFDGLATGYSERLVDLKSSMRARQTREGATLRALQGFMHSIWPGREPGAPSPTDFKLPTESHFYIAIDIPRFLNQLIKLDSLLTTDEAYATDDGKYRPVSFLEVGCGQGRNVIIARDSGIVRFDRLDGFDLNTVMIEGGSTALKLGESLFAADALEFDYGGYDVIFSFRPMANPELQMQLEERMARTMRVGAYLLAPFSLDLSLYPELLMVGGADEIWQKTG